jgi:hypothetical protein
MAQVNDNFEARIVILERNIVETCVQVRQLRHSLELHEVQIKTTENHIVYLLEHAFRFGWLESKVKAMWSWMPFHRTLFRWWHPGGVKEFPDDEGMAV